MYVAAIIMANIAAVAAVMLPYTRGNTSFFVYSENDEDGRIKSRILEYDDMMSQVRNIQWTFSKEERRKLFRTVLDTSDIKLPPIEVEEWINIMQSRLYRFCRDCCQMECAGKPAGEACPQWYKQCKLYKLSTTTITTTTSPDALQKKPAAEKPAITTEAEAPSPDAGRPKKLKVAGSKAAAAGDDVALASTGSPKETKAGKAAAAATPATAAPCGYDYKLDQAWRKKEGQKQKEWSSNIEADVQQPDANVVATFADGCKPELKITSRVFHARKKAGATTRRYKAPHLWTASTKEHSAYILKRADRSPLLALFVDSKRVVNLRMKLFNDSEADALAWLKDKGQQLIDGKISKEELDASKPKASSNKVMKMMKKPVAAEIKPAGKAGKAKNTKPMKVLKRPAAHGNAEEDKAVSETEDEGKEADEEAAPTPTKPKKAATPKKKAASFKITKKKTATPPSTKRKHVEADVEEFMSDFSDES